MRQKLLIVTLELVLFLDITVKKDHMIQRSLDVVVLNDLTALFQHVVDKAGKMKRNSLIFIDKLLKSQAQRFLKHWMTIKAFTDNIRIALV